jgi:hypothetical protein
MMSPRTSWATASQLATAVIFDIPAGACDGRMYIHPGEARVVSPLCRLAAHLRHALWVRETMRPPHPGHNLRRRGAVHGWGAARLDGRRALQWRDQAAFQRLGGTRPARSRGPCGIGYWADAVIEVP